MERKQFVSLVERLETAAGTHPTLYKLRVGALAAFGYFVLVGTVAAVLLLLAGCIYAALLGPRGSVNFAILKFMIVPIAVGAVILRSLWVQFPKPQGHRLRPADAPSLFELVDRIRKATKGPKVHKVLLTQDFNASIVQRPRLGILGWQENYLMIGLPLLHGLSPDEVRAIIAHEFGHLSRKHSLVSGWIYRVRQTWFQVLVNMEKHSRYGSATFRKLFNWYVPYFSAYSFVLMRTTELEADRFAVVLAGRQNAARALINLDLKQRAIDNEFWPGFFRCVETQPEPPHDAFSKLLEWIRQPVTPETAQVWFAQSLSQKHDYSDSHPALGDRLEAIGFPNVRQIADLEPFLQNGNQCGAEYFLRQTPADFVAGKNRDWCDSLRERWNYQRTFVSEAKQSLAALQAKAETQELTINERLERANLVARTGETAATIPLLQDVIALEPDHAIANFVLGDTLLAQGDEAGIKHIELAMEKDIHSVPSGCDSISQFLAGRKRMEEAEKYRQRAREYKEQMDLAREERTTIRKTDPFKSHALTPDALVALRAQLAKYTDLASAQLVQKVVKNFPEDQSYVMGIIRKRRWYQSQDNNLDQDLINRLAREVSFPGFTYIIALEQNYKPLRGIFRQIRGAEIYRAVS